MAYDDGLVESVGEEWPAAPSELRLASGLVARDKSPVAVALGTLAQVISELDSQHEALLERIQSVLTPERPKPSNGESVAVREATSDLVVFLQMQTDRIAHLVGRLAEVTSRVEL